MKISVVSERAHEARTAGAPRGVTFRVLGGVEARLGGVPLRLRGARHREVLVRLLAARGQVVPIDRLIDDLWPEPPPPQALAAVQSFVSQLRRLLEPDREPRAPGRVLVTEPPGYALQVDVENVDCWRLERLVYGAGALLSAGEPAQARDQAVAALALCRGPAFAEFADARWARAEADRAEELARLAVERRAEAELQLGRAADLVAGLAAHAAAHPLREEAWRLLAVAHHRSGSPDAALTVLRRARRLLREELGVDPGPVLRELEREILTPVGAGQPTGPAVGRLPARPALDRRARFVGRVAELAELHAAAEATASGRGGVVLVSEEAGAGKSTLVGRFAGRLAEQDWLTAVVACPPLEDAPAGWPWVELLGSLAARFPSAGEPTDALRLLGVGAAGAGVGRFRLHRAVGSYLAELARWRPLLVVLDDLHHADDETLALLAGLAHQLADAPALLVATMREDEESERLRDALAELARRLPRRIRLGGLDQAAVGQLVREICTEPVEDSTVAAVARRTGGNPFFVVEMARLLEAEGPEAATTGVPAGVRDVLARRITRLPEVARTVLDHAAVIGRDIDLEVLALLADGDVDTVLDGVEPALRAGLLVEPGDGRLEFAHVLVRDVLYDGLSRLRRARLHARVGAALEQRDLPHGRRAG